MVVCYSQYCPLWPCVLYFVLVIRLTWKCIFRLLFSSSNMNVAVGTIINFKKSLEIPPAPPFRGLIASLSTLASRYQHASDATYSTLQNSDSSFQFNSTISPYLFDFN
ncbi:hypothetical protein CMV_020812 [Castanea mollissima]|uniref:Uncharacterized protein n=1 Tax=Castanea mollissima TaxID=60419 RepID=A0A8J4QKS7_9ROSI|nr:hypothetical protein CMV_020812 [Castanea mollissima]